MFFLPKIFFKFFRNFSNSTNLRRNFHALRRVLTVHTHYMNVIPTNRVNTSRTESYSVKTVKRLRRYVPKYVYVCLRGSRCLKANGGPNVKLGKHVDLHNSIRRTASKFARCYRDDNGGRRATWEGGRMVERRAKV